MTEKRASQKKYRSLKKADEISSVFDLKQRISCGHIVMHLRENQQQLTRCAIMVSKKVAQLAVARNYMRRVVKQFVRDRQNEFSGLDLVIRVVRPFTREDHAAVNKELENLLQQIKHAKPAAVTA